MRTVVLRVAIVLTAFMAVTGTCLCQEDGAEAIPPEPGAEAAPLPAPAPLEREVVLDKTIRVETVGLTFKADGSWTFKEKKGGFSRLEGTGQAVHGLQLLLGVWHMESSLSLPDFYGTLKKLLLSRNPGFTVEEADIHVSGLLAKRIDLTGEIKSDEADIAIPAVYSYVVVDRSETGVPAAKTILSMAWPGEDDEYYTRYWNEIVESCSFYGPGYTVGQDGVASFHGFRAKMPEGWDLDIETDSIEDVPGKKQAFKLTLSSATSDQTIKLRAVHSDELTAPDAYVSRLKSSLVEKGIKNVKVEALGEKGPYKMTFPHTAEGGSYVMAVYVSGQVGNILQTNSFLKTDQLTELGAPLDIIGSSMLPPPLQTAAAP